MRFPELALALVLIACGGAPPPIANEPIPSTDRDPPSWTPTAQIDAHTGEPTAVATSGGAEQARALLVRLVLAIRDGNQAAIEATLAERVSHSRTVHATWSRATFARQILAGAAASQVDPDAPFDALIDPATIRVVDAATELGEQRPPTIEPSDAVVLFTPTTLGRRLLAGLGTSAIIVRPGPTPIVIAR